MELVILVESLVEKRMIRNSIGSCCEGTSLTSRSLVWVAVGPLFCQSDGYFSEIPRSVKVMLWNEVGVGS